MRRLCSKRSRRWLFILAGGLAGAEALMTAFVEEPPIPRASFALLSFAVTMGAFVTRMVAEADE